MTTSDDGSDRLGVLQSNVSAQSAISLADLLMATSSASLPSLVTDVRPHVDPTQIPAIQLPGGPLK